jgi:hypothetical protein
VNLLYAPQSFGVPGASVCGENSPQAAFTRDANTATATETATLFDQAPSTVAAEPPAVLSVPATPATDAPSVSTAAEDKEPPTKRYKPVLEPIRQSTRTSVLPKKQQKLATPDKYCYEESAATDMEISCEEMPPDSPKSLPPLATPSPSTAKQSSLPPTSFRHATTSKSTVLIPLKMGAFGFKSSP